MSYQFESFSALTLRSLRLCGESQPRKIHRRDAEAAEVAQRKAEIKSRRLLTRIVAFDKLSHRLERIDLVNCLVRPQAYDARKAQSVAALVTI